MSDADNEYTDDDQSNCVMGGTIESMRDHALQLFARAVAEMNNMPVLTAMAHQQQFLTIDETETILAEHSAPGFAPGVYAIGGESKEEFTAQMRKLFVALMNRIESNVAAYGVKMGYLDCAFDSAQNNFTFSISEKGQTVVNERRKTRDVGPSNN